MTPVSLEEQYKELLNEAKVRAEAGDDFVDNALFDIFAEVAADCGETQDIERAHHEIRGHQVDGYHYDDTDGVMTVVVAKFYQDDMIQKLDTQDIKTFFRRAETFIEKTADRNFLFDLEETSDVWRLADIFYNAGTDIRRIKILMLSNAILASRLARLETVEINGRQHSYHVLDFSRYADIVGSRNKREAIMINFEELDMSPMKFLETADTDTYSSYLISISGKDLARIYDLYGSRLLEQNVRTFLQARGKVNRGIINTIKNEPEMFFAYNNGLTATATEVIKSGGEITSIKDLQIVNGGQTTASMLYAGEKEKSDLSAVRVQMKLSVIKNSDDIAEIISNISRYANTQNKINESDLFANAPFHIRMEEFSRRIWTPVKTGEIKPTKWFYERARGQYQDSQFLAKASERRKFKAEYPREQLLNKTDLAKYYMSFEGHPHIVGKGAQANFREFAKIISGIWKKNSADINELWYKEIIAKAILFRATDKIAAKIARENLYDRGYKAHMVSYSVAWLIRHIRQVFEKDFNCELIWREQSLNENLSEVMVKIVGDIGECLTNPQKDLAHHGREWCKIEFCWKVVQSLRVSFNSEHLERYLVDKDQKYSDRKSAKKSQRLDDGIAWEIKCFQIGDDWLSILEFARQNDCEVTSDTEKAARHVARGKPPNGRQARFLSSLFQEVTEAGYKSRE